MGPRETEAMQAIVNELLAQQLIRANLSPCVVSTIFVLKKDGS